MLLILKSLIISNIDFIEWQGVGIVSQSGLHFGGSECENQVWVLNGDWKSILDWISVWPETKDNRQDRTIYESNNKGKEWLPEWTSCGDIDGASQVVQW